MQAVAAFDDPSGWIVQLTHHIRLGVQHIMYAHRQMGARPDFGGGLLRKAGFAALAVAGLAVLSGALASEEDPKTDAQSD